MSDHQDIVDLTIAYTWALDTRQFEDLRQVFAADATAVLRGMACDGIDAIIARISKAISSLAVTQHLVGNQQTRVDGDRATCRTQLQAQHVRTPADGGNQFIIAGVYEDDLVRAADGWRISHRVMRETWTFGLPTELRQG